VVKIDLETRLLASKKVFCYESTNRKFNINVIVVILGMFTCDEMEHFNQNCPSKLSLLLILYQLVQHLQGVVSRMQ
jgi:hypothetical protein